MSDQFQRVRTKGAKKHVVLTEPAPERGPAVPVTSEVAPEEIEVVKALAAVAPSKVAPSKVAPERGERGERGPKGDQGEPGKPGSTVMGGKADPDPTWGLDGDFYINTASFDFFERRDCAWDRVGNLRGNPGPTGPQGTQGIRGLPGPAALTSETLATAMLDRNCPDNATARSLGWVPGSLYHTDGVLKIVF